MRVTFWGVRGSLPTPLDAAGVRAKLVNALVKAAGHDLGTREKAEAFCREQLSFAEAGTFGGNSPCVQIDTGGADYLLCDLGSGARMFGGAMLAKHGPAAPQTYRILLSHVHWDHIMGFPFFTPAFIPGNRIEIHSCHPHLESAIRAQSHAPCFPVEFDVLASTVSFHPMEPNRAYRIGEATVTGTLQRHGNDSYGYRIEQGGSAVVYASDAEHKVSDAAGLEKTVGFFRDADLVIFDAMYSLADSISVKEDWGHSSNVMGVELAQRARVKRLVLFHHEPVFDDHRIETMLNETIRFEEITRQGDPIRIDAAYDGLVIDV